MGPPHGRTPVRSTNNNVRITNHHPPRSIFSSFTGIFSGASRGVNNILGSVFSTSGSRSSTSSSTLPRRRTSGAITKPHPTRSRPFRPSSLSSSTTAAAVKRGDAIALQKTRYGQLALSELREQEREKEREGGGLGGDPMRRWGDSAPPGDEDLNGHDENDVGESINILGIAPCAEPDVMPMSTPVVNGKRKAEHEFEPMEGVVVTGESELRKRVKAEDAVRAPSPQPQAQTPDSQRITELERKIAYLEACVLRAAASSSPTSYTGAPPPPPPPPMNESSSASPSNAHLPSTPRDPRNNNTGHPLMRRLLSEMKSVQLKKINVARSPRGSILDSAHRKRTAAASQPPQPVSYITNDAIHPNNAQRSNEEEADISDLDLERHMERSLRGRYRSLREESPPAEVEHEAEREQVQVPKDGIVEVQGPEMGVREGGSAGRTEAMHGATGPGSSRNGDGVDMRGVDMDVEMHVEMDGNSNHPPAATIHHQPDPRLPPTPTATTTRTTNEQEIHSVPSRSASPSITSLHSSHASEYDTPSDPYDSDDDGSGSAAGTMSSDADADADVGARASVGGKRPPGGYDAGGDVVEVLDSGEESMSGSGSGSEATHDDSDSEDEEGTEAIHTWHHSHTPANGVVVVVSAATSLDASADEEEASEAYDLSEEEECFRGFDGASADEEEASEAYDLSESEECFRGFGGASADEEEASEAYDLSEEEACGRGFDELDGDEVDVGSEYDCDSESEAEEEAESVQPPGGLLGDPVDRAPEPDRADDVTATEFGIPTGGPKPRACHSRGTETTTAGVGSCDEEGNDGLGGDVRGAVEGGGEGGMEVGVCR